MKAIGVDVGGTFTDIILIDNRTGQQFVHKIPSIPARQDAAVVRGIKEILNLTKNSPKDISIIVHGTTVATNAMLERNGARVVLVTTAGMEDVVEIGRQNREDIYNLYAKRTEPLVERNNRIGVEERLDFTGRPIVPLVTESIDRVQQQVGDRDPESVAISFLFSFKNPEHEIKILDRLTRMRDVYVVASSNVLPEFREFERTSTTVLEAYLGPLVVGYLERLDAAIKRLNPSTRLAVMQSNGGTMLAMKARGKAIGLAISGLAGGVIGGWHIAKQHNISHAITLDMGGTSCDISAISGKIVVRPDNEVAGLPLRLPSVDVKTIGAGGGSIAWIDEARILHVGPQSAGAIPGPASYNKGGVEATVTDANLLLGRLNPDYFLGGKVLLDTDQARIAISNIAMRLDMSVDETALGIIKISTANMVQAIREVTIERGKDPRDFVLVPFGGAGPTQGVDIAEALGIDVVLVPPFPGITSALGLVCTDLRVDLMRSVLVDANDSNLPILKSVLEDLSAETINRLVEQGANHNEIDIQWRIDMRYVGQSHELTIDIHNRDSIHSDSISNFERLHNESFGYMMKGRGIEWVTARIAGSAVTGQHTPLRYSEPEKIVQRETRDVLLSTGDWISADIFRRNELPSEQKITGPCIVEQLDTTTYIPPSWHAEQKRDRTLWLRRDTD